MLIYILFVRRHRPAKLSIMFKSFSTVILLLSCLTVSAQIDFADTRTAEHGLHEHTEILVNSQGLAQHDLSIRGSSYSGAGLSLNGLNVKSPYSAHFNSELPLPAYVLSDAAAHYGLNNVSGHLIGTAAYTTAPQTSRLQAGAKIGTVEHYGATIAGGTEQIGGFLDWEKAREIDYDANGMERTLGGAHVQTAYNDWIIDLIGSHQQKEFGTQGYYENPAYAEQQVDDSLLYAGATKGDPDDIYIRAGAAFRQMDIDDIDSRYGSLMLEGRTLEIQDIALNLRGDVENEYADGTDRTRGSLKLLPEMRLERFTVKAGLNSVFQTSERAEFLPIAGVDWLTTDNSTVYLSYMETVQQPDFQTLANNAQLQMQKSRNSELGFQQFLSESLDWRMAGFYRRLEQASDWIGGSATDLGDLNIAGIDTEIRWYPSDRLYLKAFYQWVYKDNEIDGGLYESDYPEHLLTFYGSWRFMPEFFLFAAQTLRYQTENSARTGTDFGADASLGLHYDPRFAKNIRFSFLVENLWGSDFQSIPGVKARPTTVSTGISVAW